MCCGFFLASFYWLGILVLWGIVFYIIAYSFIAPAIIKYQVSITVFDDFCSFSLVYFSVVLVTGIDIFFHP